jgi:hypothetical protein
VDIYFGSHYIHASLLKDEAAAKLLHILHDVFLTLPSGIIIPSNKKGKALDLVYICRDGNNEELRYSIRSAVANLPHDNIWVVGGKPEWYTGKHIAVPQEASKVDNARNNLLKVISSPEVSESFILMNDDFFVMKKLESIPIYNGGMLKDKIIKRLKQQRYGSYLTSLNQMYLYLAKLLKIIDVVDYDIHVPMVMEKSKLAEALKHNVLWRSTYGNMFNIGGIIIDDVKILRYNPQMKFDFDTVPYLSTEDDSFEDIRKIILEDMFPYPSSYESPYSESN